MKKDTFAVRNWELVKNKIMAEQSRNSYTKRNEKNISEYAKLPPQALELEEAVLGALMLEKDAYSCVSDILKEGCFYKDAHKTIFRAIVSLASRQEPVDLLTVPEELKKEGVLEDVGGAYYIAKLTAGVTSTAHLEYHSRILAQKSLARELITFSSDIQRKAFDEKTDIDDLMQEAESRLFEISNKNMSHDFQEIKSVLGEAIKRIEDASNKADGLSGVASGFHKLDEITSGWQRSDLVIIAARPAMGKTAFVLSMVKNMAEQGTPVAVFDLEMSNVQLVNRLLTNVCEISGKKIRDGKLDKSEWDQLMQRSRILEEMPIYLDDSAALNIIDLNTKARRLVKDHGVKCIVIDYLQLMNASGMKFGSREQEVSLISRSLKQLAKELDIPIIALSQLNRGVEKTEDKRPGLADLRESGAIEQDADMVLFIHRPEYYKIYEDHKTGEDLTGIAEIIIAKHRNGGLGDVKLRFRSELARFQNLDDKMNLSFGSVQQVGNGIAQYGSTPTMSSPTNNFDGPDFSAGTNTTPF